MIERAKKFIEQRNFSELENLWMEMLEQADISLKDPFYIADELKAIKETTRGYILLEILANHLENQNRLDEAIEVYKKLAYFTDNDKPIRKRLINLYKKRYSNNERIERFLELSGIEEGEHFFRSLEKLEGYLKFDIGRVFYFERYGLGEVVSMNPEKRELVIDFQKQKGYFVKFDVARGLLKSAPEGHYLYKKYKSIDELKRFASEDAIGLVKYLLKSLNEPLSSSEIKIHLSGIVGEDELDRFWEKVRKRLEKDVNVKVEIRKGQKVYQYIEGFDKKGSYLESFNNADLDGKYELVEKSIKEQPELFDILLEELVNFANKDYNKEPARAMDILYLCEELKRAGTDYTIDEILKSSDYTQILLNLKNFEHKKKFLKEIQKREPESWQRIFLKIMEVADDTRLIDEVERQLKDGRIDLDNFYRSVFLLPQRTPGLLIWLLKKTADDSKKELFKAEYLSRLITSLEYIKEAKQTFLKTLTLERFDEIIKDSDISEVSRIKEALARSTVLKAYEKNDYLRIIDFHFPQLQDKKEDYIYATQEALDRKRRELEHLMKVEIPENKKEISRAREYGDLSENFEYKAAKERQDQLYQKVRDIETELLKVRIIDFNNIDTSKVGVGTRVFLKNFLNGEILEYTILGPWDSDFSKNIISNESPLAKDSLLNKRVGDKIELQGKIYEIISIEKAKV